MNDENACNEQDLDAGDLSAWLARIQGAIRGEHGSDVPCGGCTACCTSSQFVHIDPDESDTLSHIPAELLFPAPGLPPGHVVLGYDERGHCPMLVDNQCSIYEHRPKTCRAYDCRVFPATGTDVEDDGKVLIARQARRWEFTLPTPADRARRDALHAAARFLQENANALPEDASPSNATQRAVAAIELHELFLQRDRESDQVNVVAPALHEVRVMLTRRRERRDAPE